MSENIYAKDTVIGLLQVWKCRWKPSPVASITSSCHEPSLCFASSFLVFTYSRSSNLYRWMDHQCEQISVKATHATFVAIETPVTHIIWALNVHTILRAIENFKKPSLLRIKCLIKVHAAVLWAWNRRERVIFYLSETELVMIGDKRRWNHLIVLF